MICTKYDSGDDVDADVKGALTGNVVDTGGR